MRVLLAILMIFALVGHAEAKRHKKRPPTPTPSGWTFYYGKPNPIMNADGVSSNWTASPYVEPHYWLRSWQPMLATQTLVVNFKIETVSGAPVIKSTECATGQNPQARAALMLGNGNNATYWDRAWWGARPLIATDNTYTITAPLAGPGWGFVSGDSGAEKYPREWAAMLANTRWVGLTFNGCSSAGHGAYVTGGTAKITILSVTVN